MLKGLVNLNKNPSMPSKQLIEFKTNQLIHEGREKGYSGRKLKRWWERKFQKWVKNAINK